jgi:hypothetical protein
MALIAIFKYKTIAIIKKQLVFCGMKELVAFCRNRRVVCFIENTNSCFVVYYLLLF